MITVTERDTATDAGSRLTDGYHLVMFSTAVAAVPLRARPRWVRYRHNLIRIAGLCADNERLRAVHEVLKAAIEYCASEISPSDFE
jgi:hypothetical protein